MTAVVVTGTGLLTAAGLGHDELAQALASGSCFARTRRDGLSVSEVSRNHLFWPSAPEWQGVREYAGLGSQLALTACHQALTSSLVGAKAFAPERCATVAVAGDDWTEQSTFDRAIQAAASTEQEARLLFEQLEDPFLLRTFRWSVGFGIGALTGFQGPSVGIDAPCFGGLTGLRHAMDLLESGEVDAVILVGVDTIPRLDVVASLEAVARDVGHGSLCFAQGAAAILLERSSNAALRGVRPLASVLACDIMLDVGARALPSREPLEAVRRFESAPALGTLSNAGALVDVCLASQWLARESAVGRATFARVEAAETFWAQGAARARLGTCDEAGA